MRIYYASQSFYPFIGGVPTYLLNLCREMVAHGNEVVEVHLRPSDSDSTDEIKGIKIIRVPREPIDNEIMLGYSKFKESVYKESHYNLKEFSLPADQMPGFHDFNTVNEYFGEEIKSLLEEDFPDIVHIHDFQLLFAYRYVPRGTPLILTWHIPFIDNMSPHLSEFLIKHLNEYDKIVFSSPDYIEAAVRAGLPREKTELIYPIANTKLFKVMDVDKGAVRRKYGIPDDKIILCVQRIDAKSGHEQLIRALPLIKQQIPNAKIVFVGSESLSNKLSKDRAILAEQVQKLISDMGLNNDIIFTGNIDYAQLPEVYNSVDIVALCSKNEGFGLSVTEGMACGRPIVGTKVGGIPLQVQDNVNGFLVDVNDVEATADAAIRLLQDTSQMGKNSIDIVNQKFKMEMGIQKHLALYNNLKSIKDEFHKVEHMDIADVRGIIFDLDRTLTNSPAKVDFDPSDFSESPFTQLQELGKDLFLCTGRTVKYIRELCAHFPIWRCVIAENGSVIYFPQFKKTITLNTLFMAKAKRLIGESLPHTRKGKVITSNPLEDLDRIKVALGDLVKQVDFVINVDEVMVLPKDVNKGLAIRIALQYLNIDIEKTIVVGDGENDIDMFLNPGFKVAVSNAHPKLKRLANQITKEPSVRGVLELIDKLTNKNNI